MGMRSKEDYNEEDLARINETINSGIHSIERKPFRFRLLFLWWIVVAVMGGVSWFLARLVGAV
ncbi:MAG: DUF3094 family protein [Porticoccus sp.]|jgi:hypothetical protein|uniref:DUF3094 family protein n=1 Tax=Porticoccus sp. Uisw_050_02 TaxID=3230978 RepID=UPI0030A7D77C|tara:strand:- start:1860 stop:2048 length:189 start_codon:yes stop_codon:yes gene_type:complete